MSFFRRVGRKNLAFCVSLLNVGHNGWKKQVRAETEVLEGFPCDRDEALVKKRTFEDALKIAETQINKSLGSRRASCAVLSVFIDGDEIFNQAYGYSNFELQSRAHIDTSVRIGTITQIFTAAQVLNHMRKNRICLDHTPYKQYGQFTLRDLLNHRSGIPSSPIEVYTNIDPYNSMHERISEFFSDNKDNNPGTKTEGSVSTLPQGSFQFSSTNYDLLGAWLESQIPDLPPNDYTHVFRSQMSNIDLRSTLLEKPKQLVPFLAKHYKSQSLIMPYVDVSNRYPSSGVVTTATDLAKFADEILYHFQMSRKDTKLPFLNQCEKIWMKIEEIGELEPQNNLCSPEKYKIDSNTVQGNQYGWNIKLLPVLEGSRYKYMLLASAESNGLDHNSAVVVRCGATRCPFVDSEKALKMEDNGYYNESLQVNSDRVINKTKGIVVSLLMNGPCNSAHHICEQLALNIDKTRHKMSVN